MEVIRIRNCKLAVASNNWTNPMSYEINVCIMN